MRVKLSLGLGAIAAILLLSSVISVLEYRRMSNYVSDLIAADINSINKTQRLSSVCEEYNLKILAAIGVEDSLFILPSFDSVAFLTEYNALRSSFSSPQTIAAADSVISSYSAYMRTSLSLGRVMRSDFIDSRQWFFGKLQPDFQKFRQSTENLNSLIYKDLKLKHIPTVMKEAFLSTSTVMMVMCAATVLSFFLSWESVPSKVSHFLLTYAHNRYIFLLGVILLFIVIGMFMDGTSAMMVIAPIIAPVAINLGIDLVQLGVLMVMLCSLGAITPPFGVIIYLVAPLMKIKVQDFIKEEMLFIGQLLFCVFATAFIPALTLWIPKLLFG